MTAPTSGQADEIPDSYARYIRTIFPPEVLANAPNEITGRWEHMTGPAEREFWRSLDAAHARIAELEALLAELTDMPGVARCPDAGRFGPEQVGTIAGTMAVYERDKAAEAVRPVLDCFKRASDGWRGRVSAVILARAYAAIGPVPDYLKHVEGQ